MLVFRKKSHIHNYVLFSYELFIGHSHRVFYKIALCRIVVLSDYCICETDLNYIVLQVYNYNNL